MTVRFMSSPRNMANQYLCFFPSIRFCRAGHIRTLSEPFIVLHRFLQARSKHTDLISRKISLATAADRKLRLQASPNASLPLMLTIAVSRRTNIRSALHVKGRWRHLPPITNPWFSAIIYTGLAEASAHERSGSAMNLYLSNA